MTKRLGPIVLSCLISACGGEAPPAAGPGPAWGDSIVLREELRIGGLDGAEEYTFGYVGTVAPSPDGSLYVTDTRISLIRTYDQEGTHVGDVGRPGQGPGEYRSVGPMAVDAFELLGVVTFPFRTSFVTATGDQVWGIQAGEYREDYVVRWRIESVGS